MKIIRKKITPIVIAVVIMLTSVITFSACHFITRDEERQARQVVARVMPGTEYEENIYRWELIQAINQAFQGQQRLPTEREMQQILDNMVDQRLVAMEIQRMFNRGDIVFRDGLLPYRYETVQEVNPVTGERTWVRRRMTHPETGEYLRFCAMHGMEGPSEAVDGECLCDPEYRNIDYTDINQVRRILFSSIDSELATIQRDILSQHGESPPVENEPGTLPQPEFPIREVEEPDYHIPELELFIPEMAFWPGTQGDADRRSLEIEALRRFTTNIVQVVENSIREHDPVRLQQDRDMFREKFANRDYSGLYLALIDTYVIEFIGGEDIRRQVEDAIFNRYLGQRVVVDDLDVEAEFRRTLNSQRAQFAHNPQAYSGAVSGNQRILFRPNANYFYVKHILLPFTEGQTGRLAEFRQRSGVTRAEIEQFRDVQLVNEIRVHPRQADGFPDLRQTFTAHEVLNMVRSEVNSRSASLREADRRFTDFIYMFNTDPGAFTHPLGYAMPHDRNADSGFMPEFADGGWELAYNYQPGQVLTNFRVTDFGVHIMFYASNPPANYTALLSSFQTPAEENTWFDIFYQEIRNARQRDEFNIWARAVILEARWGEEVQVIYRSRFRDLIA